MTAPSEVRHALNVDRGVALLDARIGREVWLPRVDLDRLKVSSTDRCVACQACEVAAYADAFAVLFDGLSLASDDEPFTDAPSRTEHFGFGIWRDWTQVDASDNRDFPGLQAEWVRRVRQLRGEDVSA